MERDKTNTVNYASPPRHAANHFVATYVTLGVVSLLLGAAFLLVDGLGFVEMVFRSLTVGVGFAGVPFGWLASVGLTVGADLFVIVGSVASISRVPWLRRVLVAGYLGEILSASVLVIARVGLSLYIAGILTTGLQTAALIVTLGRFGVAIFFRWIYRDIRADFYFAEHGPPQPVPVSIASYPSPEQPAQPRGQFRVRGIDSKTGEATEFVSNARTAELARKSAVMLGLKKGSVQVDAEQQ